MVIMWGLHANKKTINDETYDFFVLSINRNWHEIYKMETRLIRVLRILVHYLKVYLIINKITIHLRGVLHA